MRTLWHQFIHRLATLRTRHLFSTKTIAIGSLTIKSISIRVNTLWVNPFRVFVRSLLGKARFICSFAHERSLIRRPNFIFDLNRFPCYWFPWKLVLVFRVSFKWNLSIFVLHSRNQLFSELGLMTGISITVLGVNVSVWLIWLSGFITMDIPYGGGFCHVLMGC